MELGILFLFQEEQCWKKKQILVNQWVYRPDVAC